MISLRSSKVNAGRDPGRRTETKMKKALAVFCVSLGLAALAVVAAFPPPDIDDVAVAAFPPPDIDDVAVAPAFPPPDIDDLALAAFPPPDIDDFAPAFPPPDIDDVA